MSRPEGAARFRHDEPVREECETETRARMAAAEAELARRTIAALQAAGIPAGHADARVLRGLIRADLGRLTAEQRELLRMLTWRWRRRLPPGLAPKLNPDDPIVRAMEPADVR